MNLVVVLEHRFDRTPDGAVWTQTTFPYEFWQLLHEVFDGVRVVARARDASRPPIGAKRVDGPGVTFVAVPYYVGPRQYLERRRAVRRTVQGAVEPRDAILLRVCSPLSAHLEPLLRADGRPYGVMVVADPYDGFAPGSIAHPMRPFFRRWFPRQLRRQCARASVAAYVTETALQRRYPPAPGAFATHFSDVALPQRAFVSAPRPALPGPGRATLVTVGTLAQLYKAPDVLIDAVAVCLRQGIDLRLDLVGDGKHQPELEARAARHGVQDRVRFLGQLPAGDAIVAQLDAADLFVLPSRQEGLPRAMIEAMARALPCIGSVIGGIPELLAPEDLVTAGDVAGLARKIREVVCDPERLARMSARNLERSRLYRADLMHQKRLDFLRHLRLATEIWQSRIGETCPDSPGLTLPTTR